jgi:type II secretory pathway component PulF
MKPEDLITLNEEVAAMARAGLPLDQGLAALAEEMGRGELQRVTAQLATDLKAGRTLPEAIERQGKNLPPFYAGLVETGIRTGRMAEVLATLTVYARTIAGLRATILDALLYPAVVLLFATIILGAVIGYLVPRFGAIFEEFGMTLPLLTQVMLAICRRPLLFLVAPLLIIVGTIILTKAILSGSEGGRRRWTRLVYALPVVGVLIRASRQAAFADLLALLVDHDVPLPLAFQLAGEASSDPFLASGARAAQKELEAGQSVGPALRERMLVPELIAWMTTVGEQRGELGQTLQHVAELYHRQVERRAAFLRTVLPPFMIIGTAGILLFLFVFPTVLPMIKLLDGLSK